MFSTKRRNTISGDTVTDLTHNVRSLSRHLDDIISDNRIVNSNIIEFMQTHIKLSDSTCKTTETLRFFKIGFNNNENKLLSLACRCRNDVAVLTRFEANGVSILTVKEYDFVDRVLTLTLVYRKKAIHVYARISSDYGIFSSNKLHRYFSRGLQL